MRIATGVVVCSMVLALSGCVTTGQNAGATAADPPSAVQRPVSATQGKNNRPIARSGPVWEFQPATREMPAVSYTFNGRTYTLDDYMARRNITSLVVVKDGQLLLERYGAGHAAQDRFLSYSVSKSITSLMIGLALDKGYIRSLDDTVDTYAPVLRDSAYAKVTLRNLLHMASGVQWRETYSGTDDVADLWNGLFGIGNAGLPSAVLTRRRAQEAPQGSRFKYATGDTQVLCYVLAGALDRPIAQATQEWLWAPLGAESAAAWLVGTDGVEYCGGGFIARARDFARLGVLVAQGGQRAGQQILPRDYVLQATDPRRQPRGFGIDEAGPGFGYGYQFWLGSLGAAMIGIYGQYVGVYTPQQLVIVQTANWPKSTDPAWVRERSAVTAAIARAFAGG